MTKNKRDIQDFLHYKNFSQIRKHFLENCFVFNLWLYLPTNTGASLFYKNQAFMWLSMESGCLNSVLFALCCLASSSTQLSSSDTTLPCRLPVPLVMDVRDHSLLSGNCIKIASSNCVHLHVEVQVARSTSGAGIPPCFPLLSVTPSFRVQPRDLGVKDPRS